MYEKYAITTIFLSSNGVIKMTKVNSYYDVVIVGGGLAGLTTAALLSKKGQKVLLLEKYGLERQSSASLSNSSNYTFSSYSIPKKEDSYIAKLEEELSLDLNWNSTQKKKLVYVVGEGVTTIPYNLRSLMKTNTLTGLNKVQFGKLATFTAMGIYKGDEKITIAQWMEEKQLTQEVQSVVLSLASSHLLTNKPETISSYAFFDYFKTYFKNQASVSYLQGGVQKLINELRESIELNNGEILTESPLKSVYFEEGEVISVQTQKDSYKGKNFVFCIPPSELKEAFSNTDIFDRYSNYDTAYVLFYDVGLKSRINNPNTHIYNKEEHISLLDISHYDKDCAPLGGQLIQGVAHLSKEDIENKERIENVKRKMEEAYDRHFPGWREELIIPRISEKVKLQGVKWKSQKHKMPTHFVDCHNAYFAGDWCSGKGGLSETSLSTAFEVSDLILK